MTLKQVFGKLHLWLGLASGLVVLIVAGTGILLVFEDELDEWANKDFYFVSAPQNAQRLPLDSLVNAATAYNPALKLTRIYAETQAPDRSVVFMAKKGKMQTWNIEPCVFYDNMLLKKNYKKICVRSVPHAVSRYCAEKSRNVVLLPSYFNLGAYVD